MYLVIADIFIELYSLLIAADDQGVISKLSTIDFAFDVFQYQNTMQRSDDELQQDE